MIPVHRPALGARETELVLEALAAGEISGTCGRFIEAFETEFAAYCGCRYGVAVSSGSAALHVAVALANLAMGDEVLVSASTNIATANAVAMQGGRVVPVDADPATWNMDVALLEGLVTSRTKAILPVHLYGHPVDMDPVLRLAAKHGLFVIEDCAEAHGATYDGRKVGSLGAVGCFSFYANKIITTGEGGMLVTNRRDLADRARSLRNLAFGTPRFVHREIGHNYRMTNIQAAIGLAQLERIEQVIAAKRHVARLYGDRLATVAGLRLPVERDYARNVYWMYALVVEPDFEIARDDVMAILARAGVETRTMFCPMNLQPALLRINAVRTAPCPVAEILWRRGLYLPSSVMLTGQQIDSICRVLHQMSPLQGMSPCA